MTNTKATHFGRAIRLMIEYVNELERLHHKYNDDLCNELRGIGIGCDVIREYMKRIREELFFSIHGFQYVQQLVKVMEKEERNEK